MMQVPDDTRTRPTVHADLPALRVSQRGIRARRRVRVLSRMRGLRCDAAPEARRLLRVLFVRRRAVPTRTTATLLLRALTAPRVQWRSTMIVVGCSACQITGCARYRFGNARCSDATFGASLMAM